MTIELDSNFSFSFHSALSAITTGHRMQCIVAGWLAPSSVEFRSVHFS